MQHPSTEQQGQRQQQQPQQQPQQFQQQQQQSLWHAASGSTDARGSQHSLHRHSSLPAQCQQDPATAVKRESDLGGGHLMGPQHTPSAFMPQLGALLASSPYGLQHAPQSAPPAGAAARQHTPLGQTMYGAASSHLAGPAAMLSASPACMHLPPLSTGLGVLPIMTTATTPRSGTPRPHHPAQHQQQLQLPGQWLGAWVVCEGGLDASCAHASSHVLSLAVTLGLEPPFPLSACMQARAHTHTHTSCSRRE